MIEKGNKEAAMCYLTLTVFALGLVAAAAATLFPASALAVTSDPRFFGTYCGEYRETVKRTGLFRRVKTYHADLAITARLNHAAGGIVTGAGKMRVDSHNIPERYTDLRVGQIFPFVMSGLVTAHGQVQGSGRTPGSEATESTATLSGNGDRLTLSVMDRAIELSKTDCGNTRPRVSIQPLDENSIPWRSIEYLVGEYDDGEDENIPDERLVWTSNLDGHLGNGRSILTYDLSPGRHTITFSATDSGGLRGSDIAVINVENQAPTVRINRPWEGVTYYENVPVTFRGQAYDREDGVLTGSNLGWSASGLPLGTGTRFWRSLYAGTHTIRLYAYDNAMTSREARLDAPYDEVTIDVIPCQTPDKGAQPAVSSAPSDTAAGALFRDLWGGTSEQEPRMHTYSGTAPPKQPAPPASLRTSKGTAQPATPTGTETAGETAQPTLMASPRHPARKGCPPAVMITAPDHGSQPVTGVPSESAAPTGFMEHGALAMERETGVGTEMLAAQPAQPASSPSAVTMAEVVQPAQPGARTHVAGGTPGITMPNPYCVTLAASAYDVEDGVLPVDDVEWTIRPCCGSYEPRVLTGGNINACDFIADYGLHRHTITVKATDSDGNTATDSVDIIVIPAGAYGVGLH